MWMLVSASALCALALAAPATTSPEAAPNADVKDVPAGAHYGYGASAYAPQYAPPAYQYQSYDVNYCSVHASFPLVGLERRHHRGGNRAKRQTSYGVPSAQEPATSTYGSATTFDASASAAAGSSYNAPAYGPSFVQRPRPFDRQGCRNTAIYSRKSCQNCCQVASRANGNSAPVVGLLLTFDPKLSADKKHHKKDDDLNAPDRALQCVCCTSRRV